MEMNIDAIIESLNGNKALPPSTIQASEGHLSPEEKKFMEKYNPGSALIIYGTLAPGQPNHSVVERIRGKWKQGIVRGILEKKGWGAHLGYYGFRPPGTQYQEEIKAFILFSDELTANWQMLDDFEGGGYKRILAKYELSGGESGVGYIYAVNEA